MKSQLDSAHPEIPVGPYCYGKHRCPHFTTKVVAGVALPYCSHLKMGSVPGSSGSLTTEDITALRGAWGPSKYTEAELIEAVKDGHYASIEEARKSFETYFETPEEFDLFLLWDQCKECGINDPDHEPGYEEPTKRNRYSPAANRQYPHDIITLTVTTRMEGNERTFEVWTRIPRNGTPTTRMRSLERFLRKLPGLLKKNLGVTEAKVDYPGLPTRRLHPNIWETADRYFCNMGLVEYATKIVKLSKMSLLEQVKEYTADPSPEEVRHALAASGFKAYRGIGNPVLPP